MPSKAVASNERTWSLRSVLERINPVAFFLGPVFEKEVRVGGRRLSTYVYRALAAFVLLMVVAIAGVSYLPWVSHGTGTAQRVQELQTVAPSLANAIAWVQMIALTLLAPVMMAPALCEERRTKTLAALLTTPLTARQIVFGTLAGRWMQIVILSLIAAPLLLGLRVLGGVPAWYVIAMTAMILSTSLLGASCGLLCSALVSRPTSAVFIAFLFTMLSLFGPPLGTYVLRSEFGVMLPLWASAVCSGPISLGVVQRAITGDEMRSDAIRLTLANTTWNIALAGFYSFLTIVLLRRVMKSEGGAGQPRSDSRPLLDAAPDAAPAPASPADVAALSTRLSEEQAQPEPANATAISAEDRSIRRAATSRTVGENPVIWRELRQSVFARRWHSAVVVFVLIALLAWVAAEAWGGIEAHIPIQMLGLILIIAQAALSTVGGITTERETKSWDVLVASPLSARQILFGKVAGAARRQILLPSVLLAYLIVIGVIPGQMHPIAIIHILLVWLGTIVLFAGTGVLLSLKLTKTSSAAAANLAIALLLWLILPVCLLLAQSMTMGFVPNSLFDSALSVVCTLNPVMLVASAVDGAFDRNWRWNAGFDYNMPGFNSAIGLVRFTVFCTIFAVTMSGIGVAALIFGIKRFNKLAGRAS